MASLVHCLTALTDTPEKLLVNILVSAHLITKISAHNNNIWLRK